MFLIEEHNSSVETWGLCRCFYTCDDADHKIYHQRCNHWLLAIIFRKVVPIWSVINFGACNLVSVELVFIHYIEMYNGIDNSSNAQRNMRQ